jgi:A/G-specific DNA glycosylase
VSFGIFLKTLLIKMIVSPIHKELWILGATICTPHAPKCKKCPLNKNCLSAFNVTANRKMKCSIPKKVIPMNFSLIQTEESVLLVKNETDSIWKNLWLPFESKQLKNCIKKFQLISAKEIQHELTHRRLELKLNIYLSSKESEINSNQQYKWIKKDRIVKYGLPKPISKAIDEL